MAYPKSSFSLSLAAILCGVLLLCAESDSSNSSTFKKKRNLSSQILKSLSEIKKDTKEIKQKLNELNEEVTRPCAKGNN